MKSAESYRTSGDSAKIEHERRGKKLKLRYTSYSLRVQKSRTLVGEICSILPIFVSVTLLQCREHAEVDYSGEKPRQGHEAKKRSPVAT